MKRAEFVAAVQVLVYAGGIMVLFLFVVMLINYRHLPEERVLSKVWLGGIGVGLAVFVLFVTRRPHGRVSRSGARRGQATRTVTEHVPHRASQRSDEARCAARATREQSAIPRRWEWRSTPTTSCRSRWPRCSCSWP